MTTGCRFFLCRPGSHRFARQWRAACRRPNSSNSAISPAAPVRRTSVTVSSLLDLLFISKRERADTFMAPMRQSKLQVKLGQPASSDEALVRPLLTYFYSFSVSLALLRIWCRMSLLVTVSFCACQGPDRRRSQRGHGTSQPTSFLRGREP